MVKKLLCAKVEASSSYLLLLRYKRWHFIFFNCLTESYIKLRIKLQLIIFYRLTFWVNLLLLMSHWQECGSCQWVTSVSLWIFIVSDSMRPDCLLVHIFLPLLQVYVLFHFQAVHNGMLLTAVWFTFWQLPFLMHCSSLWELTIFESLQYR